MGRCPLGQAHCHCRALLSICTSLVAVGQERWREVRRERIGLVLIPTLNSAIFGLGFGFLCVGEVVHNGQFGEHFNADISMKVKASPTEKRYLPSYAPVNVLVAGPDRFSSCVDHF